MSIWIWEYEGFDPSEEGLREALCVLGNSYLCTRGAAEESEDDEVHYPGTYLAGGYDRAKTEIAGEVVENEDLVNMPNWLCLKFRIADGEWFSAEQANLLEYRQELDMKKGVLRRRIRFEDDQGRRTCLDSRRLVHMRQSHLAALELRLTPENWSGRIEFQTALDGRVVNNNVKRYRDLESRHLTPLEAFEVDDETIHLKVRTRQSRLEIAQTARIRVNCGGESLSLDRRTTVEDGYVAQDFAVDVEEGVQVSVEKVVCLYSSRDVGISECGLESCKWVARATSFDRLQETQAIAWKHLWRRFDIEFDHDDGDEAVYIARILHLYMFHILQTISVNTLAMDPDVGVPPRGWHGEAYRGHILWDEIFVFPFINFRFPEITRAILMYRYRRLDEARINARHQGLKGAMFPWQSGSDGREESQEIHLNPQSGRWIPDNSNLQRHVNSAIAYNVYQYYEVSGDIEFMAFYGAEMILEIARFWASVSSYNPELDRYEILGVMGPDEFHESYPDAEKPGLDNNAYTNVMAVWVFNRAMDMLSMLPREKVDEIRGKIELTDDELKHWEQLRRKMRVVFHDGGIISQFQGYGELEEFDWDGYRKKYDDIQRLDRILEAEGDSPNRYKASKQADVLMLFYLFSAEELGELFEQIGYPFESDTIPRNINYYMDRTSYGSTLSWVVHAWVSARSDRSRSWDLFCQALQSDAGDIQGGTTPEGIHLGAMAGVLDQLQRGYTGIVARDGVLWMNPSLPQGLTHMCLRLRYHSQNLTVEITQKRLEITVEASDEPSIQIGFLDEVHRLDSGKSLKFDL